ncbi:MAG: GntR family transcriptional regulator [Defluviitaleaceae bacterium]|nr:GntR family transcriptional regulator [Defluviitaleaceae bacterium]
MKNFNSSAPIFQQIVDHVLVQIAKGEFAAGEKMPPVRNLAADYKVNPNTMQKSLEKLGEMGYLYTERTSGRFVTEDNEKIAALQKEIPRKITANFVQEMLDFGATPKEILTHVNDEIFFRSESEKTTTQFTT